MAKAGFPAHFLASMNEQSLNPVFLLVEKLNEAISAFLSGTIDPVACSQIPEQLQQLLTLETVCCAQREMALSLASFFQNVDVTSLTPGDRDQVCLLWHSVRGKVDGESEGQAALPHLVAPITGSGPTRGNRRVSLMIESRAIQALLEAAVAHADFEVELLSSFKSLESLAPDDLPMAIIADLSLCRTDPEAGRILARIRQNSTRPLHLFCLSGADDFSARLEAVRLGATRFLRKPVDVEKLLAILNGVTARIPTEPFRVLFVDDDRALTSLYSATLVEAGFETRLCNRSLDAPEMVAEFRPDVIVTDVYMPGCNGLELAALLRQDESLADTPILFLSSEANINRQMVALDLGGDDFLTKPVPLEVLTSAVVARAKRARMLKRIRRELEKSRVAAEQGSRAKSHFMADMNHELKAPLNAMLGYSQLIALEVEAVSDGTVAQRLQEFSANIYQAGELQLALINEILEFSQIEAGLLALTIEPVELAPLVDYCLMLLAPQAEKKQVRCESRIPSGLYVKADSTRVRQILLNLLSNAIKYNRAGGSVVAECPRASIGTVAVAIKDTGLGIPTTSLGALFQPFSRLHIDKDPKIEGTGLGLALVKSLVEIMGGEIGVTSQVDVGSEFCFVLPATD